MFWCAMIDKIAGFPLILLCAGRSSRMGTPKGLLDYRGRPWLLEQLSRFKAACGRRAVVVLGYHHTLYFETIPWLRTAVDKPAGLLGLKISAVVNPIPEQGQFSSLQRTVAALSDEEFPGVFILPIDVPNPGKEVYRRLSGALGSTIDAVLPRFQSQGGHPVLLSRTFIDRLTQVPLHSAEARLDRQLRSLPQDRVVTVSVNDRNVCLNLNTPDEFQAYTGGP